MTSSIEVDASLRRWSWSRTRSAVIASWCSAMVAASALAWIEQFVGLRELADLQVRLARRDEQSRSIGVSLVEESSGAVEEVRRSREVAAGQRASSGRCEARRGARTERDGVVVQRPELPPIAVRLLEVVPEDLLELGLAAALPLTWSAQSTNRWCRMTRSRLSRLPYAVSRMSWWPNRNASSSSSRSGRTNCFRRGARWTGTSPAHFVEMLDGILGEDEADDRRRFDDISLVLGEVVETSRQERVDRRRNDVIRGPVRGDPAITSREECLCR